MSTKPAKRVKARKHVAPAQAQSGSRPHPSKPQPRSSPKPTHQPRVATLADLPAIEELEVACFQDYRRASEASLRRSITSPRQSVWVVDGTPGHPKRLAGILVLWHFPHRIRIYDVATDPDARGQGIGAMLLAHAESIARAAGCPWMTLEAEEADQRLVAWYQKHGYTIVDHLVDFYHGGCHAVRMTKRLG